MASKKDLEQRIALLEAQVASLTIRLAQMPAPVVVPAYPYYPQRTPYSPPYPTITWCSTDTVRVDDDKVADTLRARIRAMPSRTIG